jgi:N-sulfoglucosamine sulfohydrolase
VFRTAFALAALFCAQASFAAETKTNILWLVAEDFGPHLGCFGTKEVWTPNLDALAADGMRFTRFFSTAPVCSPSRSAFMTGMYQTTIGAHNHRSHRDDNYQLPAGVKVAPQWMHDAGYFTANITTFPADVNVKGAGKTDWNFTPPEKPFDTANWADLKSHQPFVAQVNFQETHRTFHAPKRADPAKVEIPPYYPDHPVVREDWAKYLDAATELDAKIGRILKRLQADGLADNTVIVFHGDHGQAHVRGKQFCYDSGLNTPLIVYWPKKLPAPAHYKPGTVSDHLVAAIDVLPTFLAIAGQPVPKGMEGQPFLTVAAGSPREYVFGARDRCDETVFRFRTVRDARYRYIRNFTPERPFFQANAYKERQYPAWNLMQQLAKEGKLNEIQMFLAAPAMPAEELYDTQADPHETRNLVTSTKPEDQAALQRLRGVLEKWIADTNDQGKDLEPAEVVKNKGATKPGKKKANKE